MGTAFKGFLQFSRRSLLRPLWHGLHPAWTPPALLVGAILWLAPFYLVLRKILG